MSKPLLHTLIATLNCKWWYSIMSESLTIHTLLPLLAVLHVVCVGWVVGMRWITIEALRKTKNVHSLHMAIYSLMLVNSSATLLSMALWYAQKKHIICAIIFLICPVLCFGFAPTVGRLQDTTQTQHMHKNFALAASSSSDDNTGSSSTSKSARERGIYSRPSAAIERGSGFFIPGLEGSRIRLIFGITCLVADAANHFFVDSMPGDWGQSVAEIIAALYGTLLILQGSIEAGVERGAMQNEAVIISGSAEDGVNLNRRDGSSSRIADVLQKDDITLKTIQRMSQIIMSFTPATYFQFVTEDFGVLYSAGVGGETTATNDDNEEKRLAKLSLDAVAGSKGGRVALPSDHPSSKLLPESATRCILVQKVSEYQGSRACMIIGSDKLLPSFTKNDLRWIGQLAEYDTLMST